MSKKLGLDKKDIKEVIGEQNIQRVHSGLLGYIVSLFEQEDNGNLKIQNVLETLGTKRAVAVFVITFIAIISASGFLIWLLV